MENKLNGQLYDVLYAHEPVAGVVSERLVQCPRLARRNPLCRVVNIDIDVCRGFLGVGEVYLVAKERKCE